ncbi:hypothetical protein LTR78_001717 [Recurvomyces mirabilis]|uniref:DUF6604 domain-containing protein n=1 Tax=Recurvomyces mirabilis TaxID=574656 RepID=A0AAE0WUI1_9PEZI|nr:hypothetical protein LTR78_001717 [Recurvomyces mirabilis]KAK5150208.1 hypothetical protein LTS14_010337 [Recurvomyces mirabilis]
MDQLSLVDTHRRYKAGTAKIVTWLVSNAQRLRKSGKNKTSKNTTSNKVIVSDLLTYAERIVRSINPRISIHDDILNVLYDVISGRSAAHDFYYALNTKQPNESVNSSTQSHLHFIEVLKDIQQVSRTTYKARLPAKARSDSAVDAPEQVQDISNVFAALEIQDNKAAEEEEAVDARRDELLASINLKQKKSKKPKAPAKPEEQEYELEGIEEIDEPPAIWYLLKDLQDIRVHVRSLWQRFKGGGLSFLTISRLTENATDLTIQRCRVDNFCAAFIEACGSTTPPPENGKGEVLSIQQGGNAGLFCLDGWAMMAHFCNELRNAPDNQNMLPGNVKLAKTVGLIQVLDKAMPFLRQLVENGDDKDAVKSIMGLDNFTLKLLGVANNGRVLLDVVACVEIYIEIYDVLDSKPEVGYKDSLVLLEALQAQLTSFQQALSRGSQTLRQYLPDYLARMAADRQDSLVQVPWLDHSLAWCSRSSKMEGGNTLMVPLGILQGLPMAPSALLRRVLISKATLDTRDCSHSHIILATAYLYRAAQASGILMSSWPDMQLVVERQNSKLRFCRPAVTSVRSVWKAYKIAQGVKASDLSNNSRAVQKGGRFHASNGVVEVQPISAYLALLLENGKVYHTVSKKATSSIRVLYGIVKVHSETGQGIRDPVMAAQYKETRGLTPVQLLSVLQEVAVDDEIQFVFDHLGFVVHCTRILEAVTEVCASDLSSVPGILGNDIHSLVQVVNDILFQAVSAEDEGMSLKQSMLEAASEVLDKNVGGTGSQFVDQAKELCGGRSEALQQEG